ncbi:MAG: choice-of-anchor V domain-containing protein [Bacteroidia bacterium]
MKKLILTTLMLFAVLMVMQSFSPVWLGKQRDGSDPGHTGSPGDNFQNCTKCHGGSAENVDGWIRSNVPAEGFAPGNRYTIRAVNTTLGHTRFGFQVSPQDVQGNLLGTLIATDTVKTKLVGNGKYITYRTGGVNGVDSNVWEFDWVAPDVNEVTFYGAFNSNHEGHKGGDRTQLSQLKLYKQGFTSISEFERLYQLKIYPNPVVTDNMFLEFELSNTTNSNIAIFDLQGKLKYTFTVKEFNAGKHKMLLQTSNLDNGIYLLKIEFNNHSITKRILVSK